MTIYNIYQFTQGHPVVEVKGWIMEQRSSGFQVENTRSHYSNLSYYEMRTTH